MLAAVRLMALVVLCAMTGRAALAQAETDFFRNKTIKLTITFEPGGSYDLYARLAATHLPKHLAGQPAMTVQYQPGAGGLVGILHFAEKAAQDGTELAILPRDVAINQRRFCIGPFARPAAKLCTDALLPSNLAGFEFEAGEVTVRAERVNEISVNGRSRPRLRVRRILLWVAYVPDACCPDRFSILS